MCLALLYQQSCSPMRRRWHVSTRPSSSGAHGLWVSCGRSVRSASQSSRWSSWFSRPGWGRVSSVIQPAESGVSRLLRLVHWACSRCVWRQTGRFQSAQALYVRWPLFQPSSLRLCWCASPSPWCGSVWAACVCFASAIPQPCTKSAPGCSSLLVRVLNFE